MTSLRLYSELDLLNIIIAMSSEHNSGAIDNIFFKEGYRIVSIDRSVDTAVGTVKFDIYLSNPIKNTSLGFELKGFKASNLETEQLNKYESLPVKQYLSVGGAFYKDIDTHNLQTILGINKSRVATVTDFLQANGYNFPVLTVDSTINSLQIVYRRIIDKEICEKLSDFFYNSLKIPTIIFYDKESKLQHVAPRVINKIFQYAKINHLEFTINEVVNETFCSIPDLHNLIGTDIKKAVMDKIKKILKDMSKKEFSSYLYWDSQNKKWLIKRINRNSHQNTDAAFLQLGKQYISRLKQEVSTPFTGFEQLSLFEDDEAIENIN
ncbi:hypothetical protein [Ferdinandcohnia sp. SAFN-114]|uniref:hypothetical protein n=1 Tax=Ferdinandcohnia sp. SAFN-114 TaxID=3387275 RepID=UPI003F81DEBB